MPQDNHDWIVFHRVRLAAPVNGTGAPFPGPAGAEAWRFYPASPIGPDGMRTNVSDEWGGFGLYPTRAAAQAVYDTPEDHLPFLRDAVEAWHALLVPFAHRGTVNWRGTAQENDTITPCARDPGGPLVVLTSAGYTAPGPDDLPRIREFLRRVDEVQDYYGTLPGNVRRAVYSGAAVDGHDGVTVSIWRDDRAMLAAAYRPGNHKTQLDHHKEVALFDRSSFSRARVLASRGAWNGTDPTADLA